MTAIVEVRTPGSGPRTISLPLGDTEFGRECSGVNVEDSGVSRRHLVLTASEEELTVRDLGSTNGTLLNGRGITSSTALQLGDVLRIASTEIEVVALTGVRPTVAVPAGSASRAATLAGGEGHVSVSAPEGRASFEPRPELERLEAKDSDAAIVRFRKGSAAEPYVSGVVTSARRARRKLSGLGSEPWGVKPQICLVDPFPDPESPGQVVTTGSLVDAARGEIWMVVNAESPPEPLERPLALLFGSALPAGADIALLLEGYGLHLAGIPVPNEILSTQELPPLSAAGDDLAGKMALSFVSYLVERGGDEDFRRLLVESRPGRLDSTAMDIYGSSLAGLEEDWRAKLEGGQRVKTGEFLRMTLRYLRPHVRREVEIFIYMLASLAFTMVFPFAIRRLLDTAIPAGDFSQVLTIVAALGVAFAVSLGAGLRRAYVSAYVSSAVVRQIRVSMFSRLQSLSTGWFARHQQGDVLSRVISDVGSLEQGISETLREGIFQTLSLLVSSVILITLNPLLAAIVIVGAPLVAFVYRSMADGARKRSLAVQEQIGALLATTSENYSAQKVVKAFALESREQRRFRRASDRLFSAQLRLQLFGGLFGLSVQMIFTLLRLLVLALGAWLILRGNLSIGGLVAFVSIMGDFLGPVTSLTSLGQQVQASTGSLERVNEVLDATPDVESKPDAIPLPPLQSAIVLSKMSFSYSAERKILDGIDAEILAGSRVAFVGPTGAGKSSVLQLLMRFADPDEGAVLFDGRDIRSVTLDSLRGQLGVVFQDSFLFDTTIRENIEIGKPGATDAEVEAAARAAELHDFIAELPRGYDTMVGEGGNRLSGGQRQRVAIARALIRDPRVIILDEATSALDPKTERHITATLLKVGRGRTTVAVTHRLTSITDFDRIFVIVSGRLVEQGTHKELIAQGGTYAGLWAEQMGGLELPEPPFDAAAALAKVPVFASLDSADLAAVVKRLRSVEMPPGDYLPDREGQLVLIRRGRARILAPSPNGRQRESISELGPGDAFGVSSFLGQPADLLLASDGPLDLLVLNRLALPEDMPSATHVSPASPVAGRRLSRLSLGPRLSAPPPIHPTGSLHPADARLSVGPTGLLPR